MFKMKLLISPTVPVPRCEGGRPEGHRLSHLRAQCRVAVPHPELQTARCRWSTPLISQSLHCTETVWCCRGPLGVCCVIQNSSRLKGLEEFLLHRISLESGCCVDDVCVCDLHLQTELKELSSSLTTEEMVSEIKELKAECSGYTARLEKIKSATNHVTPKEKEKVGNSFPHQTISETW